MDIEEFERQVVTGEITDSNTDFKYYFEEAEDDDIRTMRKFVSKTMFTKKPIPIGLKNLFSLMTTTCNIYYLMQTNA